MAPVLEAGASTRAVYLPAGATWVQVWADDAFEGGQKVDISAPIGEPPVFSRDVDRPDLRDICEQG